MIRDLGGLSIPEIQQLVGEMVLRTRSDQLRMKELEEMAAPPTLEDAGVEQTDPVPVSEES